MHFNQASVRVVSPMSNLLKSPGTVRTHAIVEVIQNDGTVALRNWKGRSRKTILKAARQRYTDAKKVSIPGATWTTNHYGAH